MLDICYYLLCYGINFAIQFLTWGHQIMENWIQALLVMKKIETYVKLCQTISPKICPILSKYVQSYPIFLKVDKILLDIIGQNWTKLDLAPNWTWPPISKNAVLEYYLVNHYHLIMLNTISLVQKLEHIDNKLL